MGVEASEGRRIEPTSWLPYPDMRVGYCQQEFSLAWVERSGLEARAKKVWELGAAKGFGTQTATFRPLASRVVFAVLSCQSQHQLFNFQTLLRQIVCTFSAAVLVLMLLLILLLLLLLLLILL